MAIPNIKLEQEPDSLNYTQSMQDSPVMTPASPVSESYFPNGRAEYIQASANRPDNYVAPESPWPKYIMYFGAGYLIYRFFFKGAH